MGQLTKEWEKEGDGWGWEGTQKGLGFGELFSPLKQCSCTNGQETGVSREGPFRGGIKTIPTGWHGKNLPSSAIACGRETPPPSRGFFWYRGQYEVLCGIKIIHSLSADCG